MNIGELGKYLSREDVPLGMRINTLVNSGLPSLQFVSFGESLVEQASLEELTFYKEHVKKLNWLIRGRRAHLGQKS